LKAIQVYFCDLHPKYAIILNKEKQKGPGMPRKIISFLIFFMLAALPAHGENAMDYYNLGVKCQDIDNPSLTEKSARTSITL